MSGDWKCWQINGWSWKLVPHIHPTTQRRRYTAIWFSHPSLIQFECGTCCKDNSFTKHALFLSYLQSHCLCIEIINIPNRKWVLMWSVYRLLRCGYHCRHIEYRDIPKSTFRVLRVAVDVPTGSSTSTSKLHYYSTESKYLVERKLWVALSSYVVSQATNISRSVFSVSAFLVFPRNQCGQWVKVEWTDVQRDPNHTNSLYKSHYKFGLILPGASG